MMHCDEIRYAARFTVNDDEALERHRVCTEWNGPNGRLISRILQSAYRIFLSPVLDYNIMLSLKSF